MQGYEDLAWALEDVAEAEGEARAPSDLSALHSAAHKFRKGVSELDKAERRMALDAVAVVRDVYLDWDIGSPAEQRRYRSALEQAKKLGLWPAVLYPTSPKVE